MSKKKRATRIVHGTPPRDTDRAVLLAQFTGFPCPEAGDAWIETWNLWLRPMRSTTHGWWSFKLTAPMWVRAKANYWISWHVGGQDRFSRVKDHARLRDGRPELYEAVRELMLSPIGGYIGDYEMDVRVAPRGALPANIPLYIENRGFAGATREPADLPPAQIRATNGDNEDLL